MKDDYLSALKKYNFTYHAAIFTFRKTSVILFRSQIIVLNSKLFDKGDYYQYQYQTKCRGYSKKTWHDQGTQTIGSKVEYNAYRLRSDHLYETIYECEKS